MVVIRDKGMFIKVLSVLVGYLDLTTFLNNMVFITNCGAQLCVTCFCVSFGQATFNWAKLGIIVPLINNKIK